jgi:hypothetical protein
LVVITGRFPLEELNRCLRISGYAGKFYGRISNVARVSPMIIPSA